MGENRKADQKPHFLFFLSGYNIKCPYQPRPRNSRPIWYLSSSAAMLQTRPSMVVRKKLLRRKQSNKDALDRCMAKGIINSIMIMINFGCTTLDQNNEAQSSIPNKEHKSTSGYGPATVIYFVDGEFMDVSARQTLEHHYVQLELHVLLVDLLYLVLDLCDTLSQELLLVHHLFALLELRQGPRPRKVKLIGGYYDAGDNVKFGWPMSFSISLLSAAAIEYETQISSARQLDYLRSAIRWGADFILSAHTSPTTLYTQI